jgi:hypothetical protein
MADFYPVRTKIKHLGWAWLGLGLSITALVSLGPVNRWAGRGGFTGIHCFPIQFGLANFTVGESEQRAAGCAQHGRVNRRTFSSKWNPLPSRHWSRAADPLHTAGAQHQRYYPPKERKQCQRTGSRDQPRVIPGY